MTSPEMQTTILLSSLRNPTAKLVSLSTPSEANDLAAFAYTTQIVVPASIFLSYVVETLSLSKSMLMSPLWVQKCKKCERTSRKNQKQINFSSCFDLFHVKCVCLSNDITTTQSKFKCTRCLWTELPFHANHDFYNTDHELFASSESPSNISVTLDPGPDEYLQSLIMRPKHLKVMHLNTQSMVSAFGELLLTLKQYPFNVISLSET